MAPLAEVRRPLFAVAAVATALLLAGCAPGSGPVEDFPGLPVLDTEGQASADAEEGETGGSSEDVTEEDSATEAPEPTGDVPVVQYLQEGGRLAITIWGSSTCPVIPTSLHVTAEAGEGNAVEAKLPDPEDGPCTMDFVPHTTVFSTPADVTTTEPLEVTIGDAVVTVPIK